MRYEKSDEHACFMGWYEIKFRWCCRYHRCWGDGILVPWDSLKWLLTVALFMNVWSGEGSLFALICFNEYASLLCCDLGCWF